MCRLAAYTGPPISLDEFLLQPEHSLVNQSWRPREMREATMNADGFGIAWFADDDEAACYKNAQPIWSDANLTALGRSLIRDRWLASVRSATLVSDVSYANTQPFTDRHILFSHNGYLENFTGSWRSAIRQRLHADFENRIHGTTDSEYLFALFCQLHNTTGNVADALRDLVEFLEEHAEGLRALLNIVISTPSQLVALRHAIGDVSPTLYYHIEGTASDRAIRIASESLTADGGWTPIDENRIFIINEHKEISSNAL